MEEGVSNSIRADNNNNPYENPSHRMWKRYCCAPKCDNNNRKNPELFTSLQFYNCIELQI